MPGGFCAATMSWPESCSSRSWVSRSTASSSWHSTASCIGPAAETAFTHKDICMSDLLIPTRRQLIAGAAGLAAAVALPLRRARAAVPTINIGYFIETKPTMIAKAQGWFEDEAKAKINWIEVASGAQINAGVVGGLLDSGIGICPPPSAAGLSQGIPYKLIAMLDNIGAAEEMTVRASDNIK